MTSGHGVHARLDDDEVLPVVVLGAGGYVGGEFLRLLATHPNLELGMALSQSRTGDAIASTFPHLELAYPTQRFENFEALTGLLTTEAQLIVLGAMPHGASAGVIADLRVRAERDDCRLRIVDTSADFRFEDVALYERVYGSAHGAPAALDDFGCQLPDLAPVIDRDGWAHPGCFTTCATLAIAPLHRLGWATSGYSISAVTGSTGSGREPSTTTHHPERHGSLKAYKPLAHRHEAEMQMLLERVAQHPAHVRFVPHSGSFARGIHATVFAQLDGDHSAADLLDAYVEFYRDTPFVVASSEPPQLKPVVGSNLCRLGVTVRDRDVVICSVIDNLTKGAAGGALHCLNRMMGWPIERGLTTPGLGWT